MVAVVIGIDGYRAERPLRCATNDAVSLSEVLKKVWRQRSLQITTRVWPYRGDGPVGAASGPQEAWGIELPPDAQGVTREGVLSAVREATVNIRPDDTLLFYFAGHGRLVDRSPCLITIGDGCSGDGIDFLRIREIQRAAANCPSPRKVMILDCCQSSDRASEDFFDSLRGLAGDWSILTSCSPGERSLEDVVSDQAGGDYLEQGLFTASLVRGLRGEAALTGDGSVSLMELATFVCQRVQVESKERVEGQVAEALLGRGHVPPAASMYQHPVLLSAVSSLGGPLQTMVAPVEARSKQDLRRRWPSRRFGGYLRRFMWGPWPIEFSRRHMFREGGAFLYAGTLALTLMWFSWLGMGQTQWMIALVGGLGGAVLWWATLAVAVAANEDGWHEGAYVAAISYLLWHGVMLVVLALSMNAGATDPAEQASVLTALAVHLFLIYLIVLVFGCNASYAIIALAEPLRTDQRREIREAITAFRQFRSRAWHVDIFNLLAMVSARPSVYYYVFAVVVLVVAAHTAYVSLSEAAGSGLWIILLRNLFVLVLAAWAVFWYSSAFQFLRREVYKR